MASKTPGAVYILKKKECKSRLNYFVANSFTYTVKNKTTQGVLFLNKMLIRVSLMMSATFNSTSNTGSEVSKKIQS